jgi:hypothetical protein
MQRKGKVAKSRIKSKKNTRSEKTIYKKIPLKDNPKGLKGPAAVSISPEDLLDEILSKWQG